MTELDRLLSEFIDAWNAGEAPAVEDYLDRAGAEADELAQMIGGFLDVAPPPPYSDETLRELRRDPAVRASVEALSGESGLLPSVLPRLRGRARLRREEVVARLAQALGLPHEQQRTARYLHGLEAGTLASASVSRRVLAALGDILGVGEEALEQAADMPGLATQEIAGAYLRAEPGAEPGDALGAHAALPAPEDWDELDRLFLGGRE